ncbi:TonB-dependent receptor [Sphingosinicella sp.]|uniref:TonB-dependent receptor n=1 Tax=Sphingosinicella sp. TaxID=1917971 RepID=UPI001816CA3A|nr:TonB-dependent receptor [Sphingosinicella sp.]MBA4760126.1 TonB-dependent receptor [Sphingosinicella sp.]
MKRVQKVTVLLCGSAALAGVQPALAQSAPDVRSEAIEARETPNDDAIIVTARRREESLIAVPVVVTAVAGEALQNRGVVNLDGLSRIVPQLLIGPQGGAVQGGNISIRGISGPDSNPFGDQAVSFTIDGVQIAKSSIRRMTDFDVAQVEVLKGPQALFFGKNSMAGIVTIRTNDPGDHLEVGAKFGYELNAREMRAEGYFSTPITDSLGFRLAGQYSDMQGYLIDQTPRDSIYFADSRNPQATNYGVRATLKFEPASNFDARFKFNYGRVDGNGPQAAGAFVSCPLGVRQFSFLGPVIGDNAQCGAGKFNVNAGYGPVLATIPATLDLFRSDGKNFQVQDQYLSSLVMNFRPSEKFTITSATGLYKVVLDQCQNYESSYAVILPSCNTLNNKEYSQELNLSTDLDGPFNFSSGLYYSNIKARTQSYTYLFGGLFPLFDAVIPGLGGPNTPVQINNYSFSMKGEAYSAFVEGTFEITPQLELSGGVRYSYEKKRLTDVRDGGGLFVGFAGGPNTTILDDTTILSTTPNARGASLLKDHDSWKNWSPEATVSFRPNDDLTLFASYKQGFLSGSFNSSSVELFAPDVDLSYKPQTIKGFEAGVKARLGRTLLVNAAAYTYKINDLQVVNFTNATSSIRNAASAKVEGFEADFTWRTPLDGLSINGALAYNNSRYKDFATAPCYNGQTIALGCNLNFSPAQNNGAGGFEAQQLAGQVIPRSPKWNIQAGFNYDTPIGDQYKLGLTGGLTHSSSYLTDASNDPASRQKSYTLFDTSVRFGADDDMWQISVIGRNLTNKFIFVASPNVPFTPLGNAGTGTATGTLGDRFAYLGRGREVLLQVAFKFGR